MRPRFAEKKSLQAWSGHLVFRRGKGSETIPRKLSLERRVASLGAQQACAGELGGSGVRNDRVFHRAFPAFREKPDGD
jgi:hypothetical protein